MKKTGVRQMIFGILGSLACGGSVMGCYPLVPAYFTALYLEQVNETFTIFIVDKVEPRRDFIEKNAKYVQNLDV